MSTLSWQFTPHARERMEQMGVTIEAVLETLRYPELSYPGSRNYPAGRTVHVRANIAVVVGDDDHCVITVLWHRLEGRRL